MSAGDACGRRLSQFGRVGRHRVVADDGSGIAAGVTTGGRIRRPGAGRPDIEQTQPGVTEALNLLVEPLTRGDPMSPLRCKSAAKLAGALTHKGGPSAPRPSGDCSEGWATGCTRCRRRAKAPRIPIGTRSSPISMRRPARSSRAGSRSSRSTRKRKNWSGTHEETDRQVTKVLESLRSLSPQQG